MSDLQKKAEAVILELVKESPERAMSFLASHFVGLMSCVVAEEGGDPDSEIRIEGDGGRDITIHASKDYE